MDEIDRYLDLGYTGIVRVERTDHGETIVCRDKLRRCLRLTVVLSDDASAPERFKIERNELISESQYRKSVVEFGILDNEMCLQERNRRRMARIAVQHELSLIAPICPLCGQKMAIERAGEEWHCGASPACRGRRPPDSLATRYLEVKRQLAT
jgi:hypothetical protein